MFSDDGTRLKFEASWDVVFWDHAVRREAKLMHCPDCDGNGTGPKQVDHHQDATTHREARRHEYNPEAILQFGNRYRGAWKDCVGSTVGGGEGVSFEPEPVHGGTLQKFLRYWMMSRLWGLRWPKRGNLQTPGRKRENTPAKSLESQPNHHRLPLLVSNPSSCVDVSLVYVFSKALTDRPRKCDGSGCSGVFDWTLIADGTRHRV